VSIPLATNRAPAYPASSGVLSPFRFSARGDDVTVDRGKLEFHIGAGPVFWGGGYLPEDDTRVTFTLKALTGLHPHYPAVRTVMPNNSIKLEKLMASQDQEAIYECGGLEAPADPQAPIMLQFTLSLAEADVDPDVSGFTGVLVGLKIGNTGVAAKFFTVGGVRRIELHYAQYSTSIPPGPSYVALYDWDQMVSHTYKLLWHPRLNAVRLYASSGQDLDTPDKLLIDGQVSAFPGPLSEVETPSVQPVAYFGHGYLGPTSTSYWHSFYLHNNVSSPVIQGLFQGGHTGLIQTDEVGKYFPTALPRDHAKPWPLLPTSFGAMAGVEELTPQKELWVVRGDVTKSFGFHRVEPGLRYGASVFDFRVSGELLKRAPGVGEATGMELYTDDGVKQLRFAMLDILGTQSVGILKGPNPELISSYGVDQVNWINNAAYRLILDPTGITPSRLIRMTHIEEGVEEVVVAECPYSLLPATTFPGPSFGFLHNGNTIPAHARMKVSRLRYSTALRYFEGAGFENVPWSIDELLKGSFETLTTGEEENRHTVSNGPFYRFYDDPVINSEKGFFLEFRTKVTAYALGGSDSPIRVTVGVGAAVDDGTYQYVLMFADMGPPKGKIIFLAVDPDLDQNLFRIRSGEVALLGTYAAVDWSISHIYRLEKSVGGKLSLYLDDDDVPAIELETSAFTPIPTEGHNRVRFGSLLTGRTTTSRWAYFRYSVSSGFDVSAFPVLKDSQISGRFDNALNTIAEVWIP
jgi:hypothetical protein